MTEGPDRSFRARWRSAVPVFIATLIGPLFIGLLLRGDAGAVGDHLKWPVGAPYQSLVINGAFLFAVLSGGAAFFLVRRPWWIWGPACVLSFLAVLFCAPFAQGWTRLDRGSVSIASGWPSKARSYGLSDVGEIRIGCRYFRLNRWKQTAGISYVVILKDRASVNATSSQRGVGRWLVALDAWDAQPGLTARRLVEPSSSQCVADLEKDLEASAYAAAMRMIQRSEPAVASGSIN